MGPFHAELSLQGWNSCRLMLLLQWYGCRAHMWSTGHAVELLLLNFGGLQKMLSRSYASQNKNSYLTIWFKKKTNKGTLNSFWSSFPGELSQSFIFFSQDDKEKWLEFQKRKWEFQSKQRAERKRLRKEAETMGMSMLAVGRGPSTGMSSFIRQQARSIVDTPWQIIQVGLSVKCSYLKD